MHWQPPIAGTSNATVSSCNPDARRLLEPSEPAFTAFVGLLDVSQGDLIRDVGNSIMPLLLAFLHGTLEGQQPFPLERVDPSRILRLAKGSPLLSLLIRYGDSAPSITSL